MVPPEREIVGWRPPRANLSSLWTATTCRRRSSSHPDFSALEASSADIAYGPWMPAWIEGAVALSDGFVRQTAGVEDSLDAFLRGWILFHSERDDQTSGVAGSGDIPKVY